MQPQADETGRIVIKSRLGLMIGGLALFGLGSWGCWDATWTATHGRLDLLLNLLRINPIGFFIVISLGIGSSWFVLTGCYSLLTGGTKLIIDSDGFSVGRRRYRWSEALPGFIASGGRFPSVRFGPADLVGGRAGKIDDCYKLRRDDLAAYMNAQMRAHLGLPAPPEPPPTAPKRKPLMSPLGARIGAAMIAILIVTMVQFLISLRH
jgi:hypothetical protein